MREWEMVASGGLHVFRIAAAAFAGADTRGFWNRLVAMRAAALQMPRSLDYLAGAVIFMGAVLAVLRVGGRRGSA